MQEQLLPPSNQMLSCGSQQLQDRRGNRPNHSEEVLKCPRCDSSHTKFCYYNNYSLAQPRHYCKTCKRYWTKGGSLRNVPVGGGCRKNKRTKHRSSNQGSFLVASEEAMLSSIRCEGATSNPPIKKEFSLESSNKGLFADHHNNNNGLGLSFQSLDKGSKRFAVNSVPLSIDWAGPGSSAADNLNPQTFESSILGLNLAGNRLNAQEPLNPLYNAGDLTSVFDLQTNSFAQGAPAPPSKSLAGPSYSLFMDSLGMTTSNSDIWRLSTPAGSMMQTMMERAHVGRFLNQTVENLRAAEGMRNFRKLDAEEMSLPNVVDNQETNCLTPDWQPQPEGLFDSSGDGPYWSHGGWQ